MGSSKDSSDEYNQLPPNEIKETGKNAAEHSFLPPKSSERYYKEYEAFIKWTLAKKVKCQSETVFLSYFKELAKTKVPPSLWSIYSMLKAVMKMKHDVNIAMYSKLLAFLKRIAVGYKPKKSKVFSASEVQEFLNEAPDDRFLAAKVCLIIGISGACRIGELIKLTINDVEKHSESLMLVKLLDTESNIDRSFVIREEYVKIVEHYISLRPKTVKIDRFFLQYRNGICFSQPMGKNKICTLPREIATYLKLKAPQLYTGHCFRRTSATLLGNAGADLTSLIGHSQWKPNVVVEITREESIENTPIPRINKQTQDSYEEQLEEDNSDEDETTFKSGNSSSNHYNDTIDHLANETIDNFVEFPSTVNNMPIQIKREHDLDEIDYFFLSMCKKLKRLPQADQTDISFRLHQMIYQAEMKGVQGND